jgi:hypothetical protein
MRALMADFWYRVEEMTECLNEALVWSSSRIGSNPAMTPFTFFILGGIVLAAYGVVFLSRES